MTYLHPILTFWFVVAALGLVFRRRRLALAYIALAGIFLSCYPPLADLALWAMSARYASWPRPEAPAEAIVVLSGYIAGPDEARPAAVPSPDTEERLRHAAAIYQRRGGGLPVVASGGSNDQSGVPYAVTMKRELARLGVPEQVIWTEGVSANTHENAVYSAKLLKARRLTRIILVTSSYHMARAELCFKRQGLEVYPAPSGLTKTEIGLELLLPTETALRHNEQVLHEVMGLAVYKFRGWI